MFLVVSSVNAQDFNPPSLLSKGGFFSNLFSVTEFAITSTSECKLTYEGKCDIEGRVMTDCSVTDVCRCFVTSDTAGICGGGSSTPTSEGFQCVDSDGGRNVLEKGTVKATFDGELFDFVFTDECDDPSSNTDIWEAYCKSDMDTARILLNCPLGTTCNDGRCSKVQQETECTGKPFNYILNQFCEGNVAVRNICLNEFPVRATNTCSSLGKTCDNGVCVSSPPVGLGGTCGTVEGGAPFCESGLTCQFFQCSSTSVSGVIDECVGIAESSSAACVGSGFFGGCDSCSKGYEKTTFGSCRLKSECADLGLLGGLGSTGADGSSTTEDSVETGVIEGKVSAIDEDDIEDATLAELADSFCLLSESCSAGKCVGIKKLSKVFDSVEDFEDEIRSPFTSTRGFLNNIALGDFSKKFSRTVQDTEIRNGGICVIGDVPSSGFDKVLRDFAEDVGIGVNTLIIIIVAIVFVVLFIPKK